MIEDLPAEFPLDAIGAMDFGDAEARDDNLLLQCATALPVFHEITSGKKDIIHGYRGTGKSSLVRLLQERALKFDEEPGFSSHILVIDEELGYRAVRDYLNRQIVHGTSPNILLRVVWDIHICYRAMKYAQELFNDSDSTLRENINEVEVLFGVSKPRVGIIELLLSQKKKVGIKLDSNLPSVVDMYTSIEPGAAQSGNGEISILRVADHIKYLARYLKEKKATFYILLDRLDDFVVQEDYDTQRALLQQLLACQADYRSKYGQGRIKVITFLRTDLFLRIDLNPLGPDKIAQRSVEIKWSLQLIRRFLAKRLASNLLRVLKRQSLTLKVAEARFWITNEEIAQLEETQATLKNFDLLKPSHWQKLMWLVKISRRKSKDGARVSSFDDAYSESIIATLFPRVIFHRTPDGRTDEIGLFEFLESHFELGYGQPNPRALLLFCSKALMVAKAYHQGNPDLRLIQSEHGQYFLFNKKHMPEAYGMFQDEMWQVQVQLAGAYKGLLACLSPLRKKGRFSFKTFLTACNSSEDEAKQFLGFCTHTGLLKCVNPQAPSVERDYRIPLVYQKPASSKNTKPGGRLLSES